MAGKTIELAVEVTVEIRQAIERAAAARDLPVSEFVERALAKFLVDAGYIDEETTTEGDFTAVFPAPLTPPA